MHVVLCNFTEKSGPKYRSKCVVEFTEGHTFKDNKLYFYTSVNRKQSKV